MCVDGRGGRSARCQNIKATCTTWMWVVSQSRHATANASDRECKRPLADEHIVFSRMHFFDHFCKIAKSQKIHFN